MDYAVLLSFDSASDQRIRQMIQGLAVASGNETYLLSGLRPHLTLAEFDTDRHETVRQTLADLAEKILRPIPVKLASAGFFPDNQSVLYLAPIVDELLLDLHRMVNNALEPLCTAFSPLYREENWVPHCTLALELDTDTFAGSCRKLSELFTPLNTLAVQLSLIACCPFCEQALFPLGSRLTVPEDPDDLPAFAHSEQD